MVCAALGLSTSGVACNPVSFLVPPPTLRGITIPLPPPSFKDEPFIEIDIDGALPFGYGSDGTMVYLFERGTEAGYFVFSDGQAFMFNDVLVNIEDNCLETYFTEGEDGEDSTITDYKVVLQEDPEACDSPSCSAPDDLGACVCLEEWQAGC